MLEAFEIEKEENRIRDLVTGLPPALRKRYYETMRIRTRDPDTYATLNWFFVAGLHHFYLGKMMRGVVNLAIFMCGVLFLFVLPLFGGSLIAAIFVVELRALFRSQIIVRDHNIQKLLEILDSGGISCTARIQCC